MTREMQNIRAAIMDGQTKTEDFEGLPLPEWMLAVTTHKDDVNMFQGLESWEKDPRKSLHLDQVPIPEVGPNEALVAIMASSINFNTVWSAIFEPLPTFLFLERNAKKSPWDSRHNLPYHILGSDASGVVLKVGPGVNLFKPGDEVTFTVTTWTCRPRTATTIPCSTRTSASGALKPILARWLKLLLSGPISSCPSHRILPGKSRRPCRLVNSTSYRMLVSENGTHIKQGDIVLIWVRLADWAALRCSMC